MHDSYLEVTFRHGRVLAAYYYLPRGERIKIAKTERAEAGLLIDYSADGTPMGIEITAPKTLKLSIFNDVLVRLGHSPVSEQELAPLAA